MMTMMTMMALWDDDYTWDDGVGMLSLTRGIACCH
jgi:hypothetical protein